MKKLNLFTLPLLLSLTASSVNSQVLDSTRTYGVHELRIIADTLTKCQEYKHLLNVTTQQLTNREFFIKEQDKEIRSLNSESQLKEGIITGLKTKVSNLENDVKSKNRKILWLNIKWGGSSALLLAALGYSILH